MDSALIKKVDNLLNFLDDPDSDPKFKEKPESWVIDPNKKASDFRNYADNPRQKTVENFYRLQHENMTYDFVLQKRENYLKFDKCELDVWEMFRYLADIVDDSDPDTDLSQLEHALQAAQAAMKAYPGDEYDWLHVTALIHDIGKIMAIKDDAKGLVGEPQWSCVGDIFPVGCAFSDKIIYSNFFEKNPDSSNEKYNTKYGIYEANMGLMNGVLLSWGHDEYMYNIAKSQSNLPLKALYILRFHSFYPWHTEGEYKYLCNDQDIQVGLKWVNIFNEFDLYSKAHDCPSLDQLAPYLHKKLKKYFPNPVKW